MTSLFEAVAMAAPVELTDWPAGGVSLLEFLSIEEEGSSAVEEPAWSPEPESESSTRARQVGVMLDVARAEAAAEARHDFEAELTEQLGQERVRVELLASEFAMDRQRYFAAAEGQVVRLALAIARRILAREVAADGMHLQATVRAAFARLQAESATVLRVPTAEVADWEATLGNEFQGRAQICGDGRMANGECRLDTNVGKVELGVEVQIAEIERGFSEILRRQGE